MENFERNLNNVNAPQGSINSHRDALRAKLHTVKPHSGSAARKSLITLSIMLVLGLTGLTVANPDWAGDLYRIISVKEIKLTTNDGQEIHIKTVEAECSDDPHAIPLDWHTNQNSADVVRELKEGDPGFVELLDANKSLERTFNISAEFNESDLNGEHETQMMITSPDGGETWIVNGDTVTDVTQISALKEHLNTVENLPAGEAMFFTEDTDADAAITHNFELHQNYPNPFNPATNISFDLNEPMNVKLQVFDVTGREVAVLLDGPQAAGSHTVKFDGRDLSSGTYFYTLHAGGLAESKNMVLMK